MNKIKLFIGAAGMLFSVQSQAITFGGLAYDAGTDRITGGGREFVGLATNASLTRAATEALTLAGAIYEDFHIASRAEADIFIDALLGAGNGCSDAAGSGFSPSAVSTDKVTCGSVSGWFDGAFGDNYVPSTLFFGQEDRVFFKADDDSVGEITIKFELDVGGSAPGGVVTQQEAGIPLSTADEFSDGGLSSAFPISWLLINDLPTPPTPPPVPSPASEPGIMAMFGLGLLGLGAIRRRKDS